MVRSMRCDILTKEPKTLEHIFYKLLKESDALRPYLQYYDRLHEDHPDRSYRFLSEMIDKKVQEERQRRNQEALVISASGGSQRPQPSAPGVVQSDATPAGTEAKGKGKGKDKGKDKGKGKGKNRGGSPAASNNDSSSDGSGNFPSDAEGIWVRTVDLPDEDRCCILNLWGRCKKDVHNGACKFGRHRADVPPGVRKHHLFQTLLVEHGEPKGGGAAKLAAVAVRLA